MSDVRDSISQRNYWAEFKDRALMVYYTFLTVKYINPGPKPPRTTLFRDPVAWKGEANSSLVFVEIGLDKILKLARKHKVTVNDVVLAALASTFHLQKKAHGKECNFETISMIRDMRSYPLPYRYENYSSYLPIKAPTEPPSLEVL
jgi:hypothetical protein